MRALITGLLVLGSLSVHCWGDEPPAAGAFHRPLGKSSEVIRLSSNNLLQWRQGENTLFDMRGDVRIYQGNVGVKAPRAVIWFSESNKNAPKLAVLDIYLETGASTIENEKKNAVSGSSLIAMTSFAGVVLSAGQVIAGELPAADAFRSRAFKAHGEAPQGPEEGKGFLGEIHHSADEFTLTNVSDSGATATLRGNAEISSVNMVLRADAVRVGISFAEKRTNPQITTIYAEGAVDYKTTDLRINCESLFLDLLNQEGLATKARVRVRYRQQNISFQFAADAVREETLYRFSTEGRGWLTTSRLAHPNYRIESSEIQFIRGPSGGNTPPAAEDDEQGGLNLRRSASGENVILAASNLTAYIESAPVFYWPFAARDIRSGAFLLRRADIGHSRTFGNFGKFQWNLSDLGIAQNDWSELTLHTDYFSARGFGAGLNFDYKQSDLRHGFARAYYIHDTATEDDKGLPVPQDNRGEFTLRHREVLGEGWKADAEFGYLSDRRFLYIYDRPSLDEDKDRETRLFLSRISHNTEFIAQASGRVNDFQNQLERQSVGYHVIGANVFNTPLLWTTHNDLSHLQLRYDDALNLRDPPDVTRLDSANEVSWPVQAGVVRAEPFVWGDVTAYSRDAEDNSGSVRGAAAFGFRSSSNFYRTYDAHSDFLQVDGLRHIITPTLEYRNIFAVSHDPEHYIQNDEIDALDETNEIVLGLRSRLQTHRQTDFGRKQVEMLMADVKYHKFLRNENNFPNSGDFIEASARWRVTEDVLISSTDNRYSLERDRLDAANAELTLNFFRPIQFSFLYKYYDITDAWIWPLLAPPVAAGGPRHSVVLFDVGYQPLYSRWRIDFTTSYDFSAKRQPGDSRDPRRLGSAVYFTRSMEGWDFSIGAEFNQGRANETVVMFRVTPPGTNRLSPYSRNPLLRAPRPQEVNYD